MKTVRDFPRKVREIMTEWIVMPDGRKLAARIWLPEDAHAQPVPGILEFLPYRRRDSTSIGDSISHPYVAGHGHACLRVDLAGTGDSDGVIEDEYSEQELADAVEIIAWIARQPWCNGNVGMWGISWGGFNALQVAARRPPALKAIMTLCASDDRYADDAHYMGGCLIDQNLGWGSKFFADSSRPPDPDIVGDRWRAMWLERLAALPHPVATWLRHQTRDAYWQRGSICENYADITCAVYAISGWADGYRNAVFRLIENLSCPRKGLIGPWAHEYPNLARPGPQIGFLQEAVAWWDHWLKGVDNGAMDGPMLRAWMQQSMPPRKSYDVWPGRWIGEAQWPSPAIAARILRFDRGRLTPAPGPKKREIVASPQTLGATAGAWCAFGYSADMSDDQRHDDGMSLVFDSAPLGDRFEILGAPSLTLELESDRAQAFVCARLSEVAPDGAATRVTYGVLNLSHRTGHEHPTPLTPGKRERVTLTLNAIAHGFAAGSRIRVSLSNAYWPIVWPSPEAATLTLHAEACSLALPVRAAQPGDAALPDFLPPEGAAELASDSMRDPEGHFLWQRDLATGEERVESRRGGTTRYPAIDLAVHTRTRSARSIRPDDPTSARMEFGQSHEFRRQAWRARAETHSVLTSTPDSFILTASLDAYEGEKRIFSRRWSETIPRNNV